MAKADRSESKATSQRKSSKVQNGNAQTLAAALKQNSLAKSKDQPQEQIQPASLVAEANPKRVKRKTPSAGIDKTGLSTIVGDDVSAQDTAETPPVPKQTPRGHQTPRCKAEEGTTPNAAATAAAAAAPAVPKKKRRSDQVANLVKGAPGEQLQHELEASKGKTASGLKQKKCNSRRQNRRYDSAENTRCEASWVPMRTVCKEEAERKKCGECSQA